MTFRHLILLIGLLIVTFSPQELQAQGMEGWYPKIPQRQDGFCQRPKGPILCEYDLSRKHRSESGFPTLCRGNVEKCEQIDARP